MGFFTEEELNQNNEVSSIDDLDKEAKAKTEGLENEDPGKVDVTPKKDNDDDRIPQKYKGKSIEDIIKMHMSAEDLIRKHSDEVGFARRMAEEAVKIRQQSDEGSRTKRNDVDPEDASIDFFADPANAVKKAVSEHPDVIAAKEMSLQQRKDASLAAVKAKVGDPMEYFNDPHFIEWLQENPFRGQALRHADQNMDANAAIEIFSNYKIHKQISDSEKNSQQADLKGKNEAAKKAAIVDGGSPGEKSTAKVYRRADLIRLQNTDPDRYERLMPEIMKAYAEGRVR